jgi:hypothetical protein
MNRAITKIQIRNYYQIFRYHDFSDILNRIPDRIVMASSILTKKNNY